jgi:hypothetical protein
MLGIEAKVRGEKEEAEARKRKMQKAGRGRY